MYVMAKMANLAKTHQMAGENFKWCSKRCPLESEEVDENARSDKNSPWVWEIGWNSGLLESGDYDENGEYDKNSETGQ